MAENTEVSQKKSKKWIIALVLCVVAAAGGGYAYLQYQQQQIIAMLSAEGIYEGISIDGTDVSGMSKEEATALLEGKHTDVLADEVITLGYEKDKWEIAFSDVKASYGIAEVVEEAYNYGRMGTEKERVAMVSALQKEGKDFPLGFTYDQEALDKILNEIADEFYQEMENSSMTRANGSFVITDEKEGRKMDMNATREAVAGAIEAMESASVGIVADVVEAEIGYADNLNVTDLLGSFSTTYSGGDVNRNTNLVVGCEYINGTVLAPNEVFSAEKSLGEQTYERGYRSAGVYVNGKVESGMGGGVCQITTTVYNAAIMAELEIVERFPHSMTVGYVPLGRDAAIADGYKDLKIKNNTEFPIYLEAYAANGVLQVNIYGNESRDANRSVAFDTVYEGTIPKPGEIVKEDPELQEGERVITHTGRTGSKVSVYKTVYDGQKQVSRDWFSSSSYRAVADEVSVGTKPLDAMAGETLTPGIDDDKKNENGNTSISENNENHGNDENNESNEVNQNNEAQAPVPDINLNFGADESEGEE